MLGIIANGCIECNYGRDVPHESVGKIVDDVDDFFADDGLGDSEYALRTSVGVRSESASAVMAVGDVLRSTHENCVKIDLIAFGLDYLEYVTSAIIATKPTLVPIILLEIQTIDTFEFEMHAVVWKGVRYGDYFERAIGVRVLLIADKGIGGIDRNVITAFVRKVDELG